MADGHVLGFELAFMKDHTATSGAATQRCDVHSIDLQIDEAPERRCAPVAEDRPLSAGQHRRDPTSVAPKPRVADGIDATVDPVQAAVFQPTLEAAWPEADGEQLLASHDSVLVP